MRWGYGLHDIITEYHLNALAKIMLVGSIMLSYAYLWEGWGAIYKSEAADRLMFFERAFGFTAGSYWAEKILVIVIPQLLWLPAIRRRPIWLVLISFGASIVLVVQPAWGKVLLGALAVGLAVGLYRIPSRDGPGAKPGPTAN